MKKLLVALTVLSLTLTVVPVFAKDSRDNNSQGRVLSETDDEIKADRRGGDDALAQFRTASNSAAKIAKLRESAIKYLDSRIKLVQQEITKINDSNRLDAEDRAALITDLNSVLATLQSLKTKVTTESNLDSLKQELKDAFKDKIMGVLMPKAEGLMLVHKFNAAVTKLGTAADKISKLIDKASAAGKDTTAMKAHLATYQTEIAAAKTSIDAAKAKFLLMKVSDPAGAKTLFQDGKALLKTAKTHIVAAHKELQAIIPLLRVALGGAKEATESATESAH